MQHRASAPDLQRVSPDTSRLGGGKSRKHRGGGSGSGSGRYRAVGVPLVGAVLFALLLFYSARSFTHVSSYEHGAFGLAGGRGGGGDSRAQERELQQQLGSGADNLDALLHAEGGSGAAHRPQHRSSWLSAAVLWAEEHQQQREQAKGSRYQHPSGCGLLPCAAQQAQRPATLVLYAYSAEDAEQQHNFAFFLKHAVEQQPWLTYRLVVAAGPGVLAPAALPELPPNARYMHTQACTTGVWGILAAVAPQLEAELAAAENIVVVGSAARGPFMPTYTKQFMHWTDAFTSKLGKRTKLVGSGLTCEGAPKGGDAAEEWRLNPFVMPHAWATDKEGWKVMAGSAEVLRCYTSPWDARYFSDSGASLALLSAGYNLDTLLTKYQGVDWWNQRTWGCNARVRPDAEWSYDGVSISPYETVFVPVSQGPLQSEWSYVRQAVKYSSWMEAQAGGAPQGNSNAFVASAWALRAQRMVFVNSRGPGCFDFDFYVQHNPDQAGRATKHALLWEHFVVLGQFQGRPHRFTCPVQVGNSYRAAAVRARGRRCFDHNHYSKNNMDVRYAGVGQAHDLFTHYADFGQFENRAARFACSDLMWGLPAGFDSRPLAALPADKGQGPVKKWQGLVQQAAADADAGMQRLNQAAGVGGGALGDGAGAAAATGAAATAAAAGGAGGAQQQQQHQQQEAAAQAAAVDAREQAAAAGVTQEQQQQAAAASQQAAAVTAGVAGAGTAAGGQQGVAAATTAGGVQQAEATGDQAVDAAAFGRIQASDAEQFLVQQQMQAAAGGDAQG